MPWGLYRRQEEDTLPLDTGVGAIVMTFRDTSARLSQHRRAVPASRPDAKPDARFVPNQGHSPQRGHTGSFSGRQML